MPNLRGLNFGSVGGGGDFIRANEPGGMTFIDERGFNSLAENASPHNPAWDTDGGANRFIVTDATAPHSPSNALRCLFPAGFPSDGSSGGHAGFSLPVNYKSIYLAFAFKYSANWQGHDTGINKLAYAWCNGSNKFVMESSGSGSNALVPMMALQNTPDNDGIIYDCNLVPTNIVRGQWCTLEINLTGNSAATHDGAIDYYVNGVHVAHHGSLMFDAATCSWDTVECPFPIWGGVGGANVANDMWIDYDHFYASGKN